MEISMLSLAKMTLYSFFLGIFFGILYDTLRIMRVMMGVRYAGIGSVPEKLYEKEYPLIGKLKYSSGRFRQGAVSVATFFGDFLYCFVIGVIYCVFLYYTNCGIFRFQSFAAAAFGFFIYYQTAGRLVITFAEYICLFLKIFVSFFLFAIAFPFKILYNIAIRVSNRLLAAPRRALIRHELKRSTDKQIQKILTEATEGFLLSYGKGRDK